MCTIIGAKGGRVANVHWWNEWITLCSMAVDNSSMNGKGSVN